MLSKTSRDLVALVAGAAAGDVVRLSGTYELTESLVIDKPLTLLGDAPEICRVVGDDLPFLVKFTGDHTWRLQGIGFVYRGLALGDVAVIESGQMSLEACCFAGGIGARDNDEWDGAGLRVLGTAQIDAVACTFNRNKNELVFLNETRGTVVGARCAHNHKAGVCIGGTAAPTLDGCQASVNGWAGLRYADQAAGRTVRCYCQNNMVGICVAGDAAPELSNNACWDNHRAGILYAGSAAGLASANDCLRNATPGATASSGILITEDAHPTLENNRQ